MAHDEARLFLEAFKNVEVAISGLNPDPIETIAQYRKRQLRSDAECDSGRLFVTGCLGGFFCIVNALLEWMQNHLA